MTRSRGPESLFTDLVALARNGDEQAWRQLIDRLKNVVWKTVNSFSMNSKNSEDAYAATVLRLAENLDRIRDPERLPGWMATTARNESLALLRSRRREVLVDQIPEPDTFGVGDHSQRIELDELHEMIAQSFAGLSQKCQQLLRLLTGDPPMQYREVAEFLGMPIGSIGETRRRCLDKLRMQAPFKAYEAAQHR